MQIVLLVHVSKALHRLEHDVANLVLWEKLSSLFHELVHVEIEILKDEVQCVLLQDYFIELNNVRMGQLHERLNFFLVDALVPPVILLLHFLDRHDFT